LLSADDDEEDDDDDDACSCCGAVVVADEVLSSPYRRDLEPSLPIVIEMMTVMMTLFVRYIVATVIVSLYT
jgi:hypothetical protein